MTRLLLLLLTFLVSGPAFAANGTNWVTEPGGTEQCHLGQADRMRCFWYFDGAGNSPPLGRAANRGTCPAIQLKISGTTPDVDPYVCHDVDCTTTTRLEGWVRSSGVYGDLTLDATNWGIYGIKDRLLRMSRQGGSGNVTAECE